MNGNWSSTEHTGALVLCLVAALMIAGCGGGNNGSASGTAVQSYLADQQGGSFVGTWMFANGSSSVVSAGENSVTTTQNANTYSSTHTEMLLSAGAWNLNPSPLVFYNLASSGWIVSPNTASLVDWGNGTSMTITPTGEPALAATISRTDLSGTPVACASPATGAPVACAVPGNYPPGAASYQLTISYSTAQYLLVGGSGSVSWLPVTDQTGAVLAALPAVGATFCDPNYRYVFQPITPTPAAGSNNYNLFNALSCAAADIAAALASPPTATVLLANQATGNLVAANVLSVTATGASAWMNNMIFAVRAGAVWDGWLSPVGGVTKSVDWNKLAVNAQLAANGLLTLP